MRGGLKAMSCRVDNCERPVRTAGFCAKHYQRLRKYGDPIAVGVRERSRVWEPGEIRSAIDHYGYRYFYTQGGKCTFEHLAVAAKALGKPLPPRAVVHHADGNPLNNEPTNLVICPNQAYHVLLHRRDDALSACGHADWRMCKRCKEHDAPQNLYINGQTIYHKSCQRLYDRNRHTKELPL